MLYVGDVNFKAATNWNLRPQWLNLHHSTKFSFFTIYLKLAAKRKYLSKYTINIPYGSSKSSILYSLDTKTIKKKSDTIILWNTGTSTDPSARRLPQRDSNHWMPYTI